MRNTEPVCQRSAGGTSTALDPGRSDVSKVSSRFYSQHKANLCQSGLTEQNVNLKAKNIRKQTELKALVGGECSASLSCCFNPGEKSPIHIRWKVGWAPERVWTIWRIGSVMIQVGPNKRNKNNCRALIVNRPFDWLIKLYVIKAVGGVVCGSVVF
jgi:hypothetical protein